MVRVVWSVLAAGAVLGMGAGTAAADLHVCNRTSTVVNLAFGEGLRGGAVSSGWWTVGPGRCARVRSGPPGPGPHFLLAQGVHGTALTGGTTRMCIAPGAFEIVGTDRCIERGYLSAPFERIAPADPEAVDAWAVVLDPA
ncbi:MAG: DUF1036 domain-containing protein [Shimia sp.]